MLERIKLIIKTKNLSASRFADMIGVQRSSVSHVLSGRNKPSLEFTQKILKRFPDIRPEWLLFGKGSMSNSADLFSSVEVNEDKADNNKEEVIGNDTNTEQKEKDNKGKGDMDYSKVLNGSYNPVVRIVLFYKDNTFKEFSPAKE